MFKSKAKRLFGVGKQSSTHQQHQHRQQPNQSTELEVFATKQEYFDLNKCHRTYSCAHCRAHLADHDQLISKLFQGNHGRAYLFNKVVNIGCKQAVQRELLTGLHAVADIYCDNCETTLGWKYEQAFVPSQKYKEGKYIIELVHMLKENNWDLTSYNARELIREASRQVSFESSDDTCTAAAATATARNNDGAGYQMHRYPLHLHYTTSAKQVFRNQDDDNIAASAERSSRGFSITDDRPCSVISTNQNNDDLAAGLAAALRGGETQICADNHQNHTTANATGQSADQQNPAQTSGGGDDSSNEVAAQPSMKQNPPSAAAAKFGGINNELSETTSIIGIHIEDEKLEQDNGAVKTNHIEMIERSLVVRLAMVAESSSSSSPEGYSAKQTRASTTITQPKVRRDSSSSSTSKDSFRSQSSSSSAEQEESQSS